MKLTQKLLEFVHRVFSKDPAQFLAFRLSYRGGMIWTVEDGYLTTSVVGGPGAGLKVDLRQHTVRSLIDYLAAQPGYDVLYGDSSENVALSALVLLDGNNDIATPNGDHLYGYTNALFSFMDAFGTELVAAADQGRQATAQMNVKTAEAEWLDEQGSYYGVPRILGEVDAQYAQRMVAEILRPRGNNIAMEAAISLFTGQATKVSDVVLYGPVSPAYNGLVTYNAAKTHNATRSEKYGLFDVEYGYDLINGADMAEFADTLRGIIDRLRDAGTHLRSLSLLASGVSDEFVAPTDGDESQAIAVSYDTSDALTAPVDGAMAMSATIAAMSDALSLPTEAGTLTVNFNYTYSGLRTYNGIIQHAGGHVGTDTLDGSSMVIS